MLLDSCLAYVGREVCVLPTYGWGWHRDAECVGDDDYSRIEAASFFTVRVERLFRFRDVMRGVVGVVTSPRHMFSGLHIIAAEMHEGEHDFEDRICWRYDLWLGPRAPSTDEWPTIEGPNVLEGYGMLGATRERVGLTVAS
jgi:hypothetical protein